MQTLAISIKLEDALLNIFSQKPSQIYVARGCLTEHIQPKAQSNTCGMHGILLMFQIFIVEYGTKSFLVLLN